MDHGDNGKGSSKNEETLLLKYVQIKKNELRTTSPSDYFYMDRVFSNGIGVLLEQTDQNYDKMLFRDGLKRYLLNELPDAVKGRKLRKNNTDDSLSGFYDMQILRNDYRDWCNRTNIAMHRDIVLKFIEYQMIVLSPICPHLTEYIWSRIGKVI